MRKIKLKNNIFKIFIFIILGVLVGCGQPKEKRFSQERFLFGTYIQMIVYSENESKANNAMEKAFKEIERIDNKYNSKNENSIIYKLNESKNKEIDLDEEGIYIFKEIEKMYKVTDGVYDITIGPLLDLWGFGTEERTEVPTPDELKEVMKKIDFSKVEI